MSWARMDDAMGEHRKTRRLLRACGLDAFGLHSLAILHCSRYLTDGFVEEEFVKEALDDARVRGKARIALTDALVEQGQWEPVDGGWRIHDYLDHNPSRAEVEARRRRDAERKAIGRRSESERSPSGQTPESGRTDAGRSSESSRARPHPIPSHTENPPTPLTQDPGFLDWLADHEKATGHQPPGTGTKARAAIAESFHARRAEGYTLDDLKLATIGAHEDDYRRENGYDVAESVLRPTKVAGLIAKGKLRARPAALSSRDLAARVNGQETR